MTQDTSMDTLQDIRHIMRRSTVFLSLSGWSGVAAGVISIIGAVAANILIKGQTTNDQVLNNPSSGLINQLVILAIVVFLVVLGVVYFMTKKQASKDNTGVWDPAARKMMAALFIPVVAGAIFIFGLIHHQAYQLAVPSSLIFYGLGLISASKYTFTDIKYVGLANIALGLICMFLPEFGLYFWAAGFGLLHIIYGILMFKRNGR
jgi:hypothetical protein